MANYIMIHCRSIAVPTNKQILINSNGCSQGLLLSPHTLGIFLLEWPRRSSLCSCLTACKWQMFQPSGTYLLHSPTPPISLKLHISLTCSCDSSSTINICTLFLTSIQLHPGSFFNPLSFISFLTFATQSHLPQAA